MCNRGILMVLYASPGDSPQKIKIFVEQPVTNDPADSTERIVEAGTLEVYSDALADGATSAGMFHIDWTATDSSLADTTLGGSIAP